MMHAAVSTNRVRLDRSVDKRKPCCGNIALIVAGKAMHAAELRCNECGRHRGWLPREALEFLNDIGRRFGAPSEPLILRDNSIGEHNMEKRQYDNSGILFRNEDKQKENDRDYRGEITINAVEHWLSGWIKDGKKGKFLSLSAKPKNAPADKSKPLADALSDDIPF